MQKATPWLDWVEYVILGLMFISFLSAFKSPEIFWVNLPLVLAVVVNRLQRFQLAKDTKNSLKDTLNLVNDNQKSIEQLVSELKKMVQFFATSQSAIQVTVDGNKREDNENIESFIADLRKLQSHQKILDQMLQLTQAEMEMLNKQFKQRPELEQINNLTTVILDLQRFINELPQWGSLQQKQLRELQEKVDAALMQLSEELNKIPQIVERAIEKEKT